MSSTTAPIAMSEEQAKTVAPLRATCLQENLACGLGIVGRAVAKRPSLPVLGHVMVTGQEGALLLAASDLEIFSICVVGARVESEGSTTIPARLFSDLVNSLPAELVHLDLADTTLHVECSNNEADIRGIAATEFPILPARDGEQSLFVDADVLRKAIARVVFAAAQDESRPVLTGVLASFEEDRLTLAAADGFRLAVYETQLSAPVPEPVSVIIPGKALSEFMRVSGDEVKPIELSFGKERNQIGFHLEANAGANKGRIFGIDLISQLIEGRFVNYRQIIPASRTTRILIDRKDLIKACRTSSIFARSEANVVTFEIAPGEDVGSGSVRVTSSSAEMGDSVIDLEAQVEGEPIKIAFNVRYMLDVLAVMETDKVEIDTSNPARPGVFRPAGDQGYTYVLMPMHIRD